MQILFKSFIIQTETEKIVFETFSAETFVIISLRNETFSYKWNYLPNELAFLFLFISY